MARKHGLKSCPNHLVPGEKWGKIAACCVKWTELNRNIVKYSGNFNLIVYANAVENRLINNV
jgi:hypothetical protein